MMHFLEQDLVLHPLALYLVAISLYALNLVLYVHAERKRQQVTSISSTPARTLRERLARTIIGALVFLIPGLFLSGEYRALFTGAFVVMQLCSLASILSSLQITGALLRPNAVTGQIVYAQSTAVLLTAAHLSSFAFVSLAAFVLTGSPSFFGAAVFLGATSIGYRRRARQYAAKETVAN